MGRSSICTVLCLAASFAGCARLQRFGPAPTQPIEERKVVVDAAWHADQADPNLVQSLKSGKVSTDTVKQDRVERPVAERPVAHSRTKNLPPNETKAKIIPCAEGDRQCADDFTPLMSSEDPEPPSPILTSDEATALESLSAIPNVYVNALIEGDDGEMITVLSLEGGGTKMAREGDTIHLSTMRESLRVRRITDQGVIVSIGEFGEGVIR